VKKFSIRLALALAAAPITLAAATAPAHAQLGGVVFDPSNYSQNILTAARTLEQINNQIKSLQNEATSLINQAKNLESLPITAVAELQAQVRRTQQLLASAQRVAYDVQSIDKLFDSRIRSGFMSASQRELVQGARDRWEDSVAGFQDAMRVQAGVVGNIDGTRDTMDSLVTASQSASGALQVAQAGNQLVALQSQQLADLTAMMAAQGRAQALEAAQRAAAQEQGREQLRRFLERRNGYQPGGAKMFHK
jgi:P-type conjugative transfer protein TrbJ